MTPKLTNIVKTTLVLGALFGFVAIASAGTWTAPTSAAPAGNVDAPINVGTTAQTKNGAIAMTGLANYGTSALVGSVAIGNSTTPATADMLSVAGISQLFGPLQVLSTVQIAGGSPAAGRVLTATDSSGDAKWEAPVSSGGLTSVAHDTTLTGTGSIASPLHVVGSSSGTVTGTGTANYLPKWTSATALGNSEVVDTGSHIDIDTGLTVDNLGTNGDSLTNGIRFGGDGSGEGIASTRVGGTVNGSGNEDGLDFYTDGSAHMSILNDGNTDVAQLRIGPSAGGDGIPLYKDNCGGGLTWASTCTSVGGPFSTGYTADNTLLGYLVHP